jgi:hypothetical protein
VPVANIRKWWLAALVRKALSYPLSLFRQCCQRSRK